MIVFLLVLVLIGGALTIEGMQVSSSLVKEQNQNSRKKVIETIRAVYKTDFIKDDSIFGNGRTLQDFCRSYGLTCRDQRGEWYWKVEKEYSGLFSYYVIKVYDRAGRLIGRVSGAPYWSNYLNQVEKNQQAVCKALIDYYRDMVRVYSYPLNWYAKNGALCHYDNGQDALDFGGSKITKEVDCSEGWKAGQIGEPGNLANITGGKWKWPTGNLEYDNANEIYTNGFPCFGATTVDGQVLTGNQPPYAVAFRLWIKTGYYTVCCGY